MLSFVMALLIQGDVSALGTPNPRPAFECAEHLTDDRARRTCLDGLLRQSSDRLDQARLAARNDARESDLDSGGRFLAEASLDAAQTQWQLYRDAECARRGALMFIGETAREEIVLDCQIALNRARAAELLEH